LPAQRAAPFVLLFIDPFRSTGAALELIVSQVCLIWACGIEDEMGFDEGVAGEQGDAGQNNRDKQQFLKAGKLAVHEKVTNF
jgi:hypothetical protein